MQKLLYVKRISITLYVKRISINKEKLIYVRNRLSKIYQNKKYSMISSKKFSRIRTVKYG